MRTWIDNLTKRLSSLWLVLPVLLASCSEQPESLSGAPAAGAAVQIAAAPFAGTDGAETPAADALRQVDGYLFEQERLTKVYASLPLDEGGCRLQLERLSGRLYVVADARPEVASGEPALGLAESEWLEATVGGEESVVADFASGVVDLDRVAAGTASVPLTLRHGVARLDLRLRVAGTVEVGSLTLLDAASAGYLLPRDGGPATPAGAPRVDRTVEAAWPVSEDTPGVAYLYEQTGGGVRVRLEVVIDGRSSTLEGTLPEPIERNHVYTVTVRKDVSDAEAQLVVEAWGDGGESDLQPDFDAVLRVDADRSEIPSDVRIVEDATALELPYTATEILLTVACDSQLEVLPLTEFPLTVEEVSTGTGLDDMNRFRIRKSLFAPNRPAEEVAVRFRRKGLEQVYPEDRIVLRLAANPTRIEGGLDFDNADYTVDFARYVDNELGRFVLPEGKQLTVEFDGEDPWVRIGEAPDDPNTRRVVGGWRPNDRTADGRRQAARLVVSNRADGSQREEYTIVRRNWGLPVTWFHGVWWCKYNARGDSRRFEDQILSSADPAVEAGKSLYDYLASCSPEAYRDLWEWAYQGDSGKGLRVVEQDGKAVLEGFTTDVSAHINKLPPDALSPDGYELPSMEVYNRVFDATDYVWMMWSGTHTIRVPWEGHSTVKRSQQRRSDVTVGSLTLNELLSVRMWSPDFPDDEGITWYGPAAQWNADGIRHSNHYNNILFGVYSPEGSGWYINGGMTNLYLSKNGAGTKDTRILRFRKSDVEFTY